MARDVHRPFVPIVVSRDRDGDYNCDGTDDDVELQAAVDYVYGLGGGYVYAKAGSYNLSASVILKNNVYLYGDGPATVFNLNNGVNDDVITNDPSGTDFVSTPTSSNIHVARFKIYGNKANQSGTDVHGLKLINVQGFSVNDIWSEYSLQGNIVIAGCRDGYVNGCTTQYGGIEGYYCTVQSRNVTFINNTARNEEQGFECKEDISNFHIIGNRFVNCNKGIQIRRGDSGTTTDPYGFSIMSNSFITTLRWPIYITEGAHDGKIIGNTFKNYSTSSAGSYDGILLADTAARISVAHNDFIDTQGTPTSNRGLSANSGTTDISFWQNHADGIIGVLYNVNGGVSDTIIKGFTEVSGNRSDSSVNARTIILQQNFIGTGDGPGGLETNTRFLPSASVTTIYGFAENSKATPPSGVSITNYYSTYSRIQTGSDLGTITNAVGHIIDAPSLGSITPTNTTGVKILNQASYWTSLSIGLDVAAQSVTPSGSQTIIGVRIAKATTYALQMSDATGVPAGGITFGTDTQLWRSAANTLKTSGRVLIQDSNLTGNSLEIDRDGADDVGEIIGIKIDVDNVGYAGGSVGIDIANITGNGTNIGIRIAAPASGGYALQLSDTNNGAEGGITFGTDTNLYRNGANSLKTDDNFAAANVLSGTYTPTRSAEANLDSNVTMTEAQYLRVGNTVTVSGRFTADPTLTATATSFEITLPVASNVGAVEDVAGVAFCGSIAAQGAEIIGVVANDTAKIQWISGDITSQTWSYTFTYAVI